jgi:MFS family permease
MRAAFARPGFRRLFGGLSASMLGDSIMLLVLSMWVKTLTGSNAQAGLTFLFMVLPSLFAPLIGVYVDRVRRKPILVWGNLASALGVLPLVLVRDEGDVWIIWMVAVLYGVSFIVLPAALNGLLKEMLPEEMLVDANSSLQTVKEGYRLFGPLAGAALFAGLGGWAVATLDAVSFVVAAAAIATIRVAETTPEKDTAHLWSQMGAGLKHLVRDRVLGHLLVGFGITLLVLGFTESSIYAMMDGFDKQATFAGVWVAIQGVGAITGGITSGVLVKRYGEVAVTALGLGLLGLSTIAISLAPSMLVVLVLTVPLGISLPWLIVAYMTMLQRRTPQALMGRVSTAAEVLMATPQAISLGTGALLVVWLDWRVIWFAIGAVVIGAALYVVTMLRDQLRGSGRLEDQGDGPVVDGLDAHVGPELTPLDPGTAIG